MAPISTCSVGNVIPSRPKKSACAGDWARDLHRKASSRLPCSAPATCDNATISCIFHRPHLITPIGPPSSARRSAAAVAASIGGDTGVGWRRRLPSARRSLSCPPHPRRPPPERHPEPLQPSLRSRSHLRAFYRLLAQPCGNRGL